MKLPSIFITTFVVVSVLEHQSTKYLLVEVAGGDLGKIKSVLNIMKLIIQQYTSFDILLKTLYSF